MEKQLHVIIKGRVQGVCFRANTKKVAQDLNIDGWVKNNSDGTVEAIFQGTEIKLLEMLNFVKKGPFGSRVEKVTENWKEINKKEFDGFRIKY